MNGVIPASVGLNRLATESSPYLRSAAHQPVSWYPWGEQAFRIAREENKPVLLDIGAVWCHWCHVMDSESYENKEIAKIINEHYVAIKVDRDERPDIDTRYQAAVSAIAGQGGWPLTAFLTPAGDVFYGGTYFPPIDRYGRVGFAKLLTLLVEEFRNDPQKVIQNADRVRRAVENSSLTTHPATIASESLTRRTLSDIIDQFDEEHGGFGSAPKFPHCTALEFLLALYDRRKD